MAEETKAAKVQRRDFLRVLGVGAGTAGAAAVGMVIPTTAGGAVTPESESGYAETEHVRRFYETARF